MGYRVREAAGGKAGLDIVAVVVDARHFQPFSATFRRHQDFHRMESDSGIADGVVAVVVVGTHVEEEEDM